VIDVSAVVIADGRSAHHPMALVGLSGESTTALLALWQRRLIRTEITNHENSPAAVRAGVILSESPIAKRVPKADRRKCRAIVRSGHGPASNILNDLHSMVYFSPLFETLAW
jgi:hypothetical protein